MRIISSVSRSCRSGEASFWNLLYTCLPSLNWFPNNQSCYRLLFLRKYPMGHSLHVNNLFGEHFQSQMIGNRICVTPWSHNTLTNFNSPANSFKFYLFEFFKRGGACVQWPVPLDTLQCGHMFTLGHVFVS